MSANHITEKGQAEFNTLHPMANRGDKLTAWYTGIFIALTGIHYPKVLSNEFVTNLTGTTDLYLLMSSLPSSMTLPALPMDVIISDNIDSWFPSMSETHRSVCSEHPTCVDKIISTDKATCCGSCTCDSNCVQQGSCCLGVYDNFTHARNSVQHTRYRCIHAQYLPPDATDYNADQFYWMISRCDPAKSTDLYREDCENPVHGDSLDILDKITPVTDPLTGLHYKNIFCAYCNLMDDRSSLMSWKFEIQSNKYIPFQAENFLKIIRKDRGNIIFIPPGYIAVQTCDVPVYNISSCNESRLWDHYEERLEKACEAFIDPFNLTYKNFFCFLCNIAGSTSTEKFSCPTHATSEINRVTPPFFAILDMSVVMGERKEQKVHCDNSQFVDEITMTCQNVLCHKDKQLEHGKCIYDLRNFTQTCYAIFFNIVPVGNVVTLTDIENYGFRKDVENFIIPSRKVSIQTDIVMFYKTSIKGKVEKVIAFITMFVSSEVQKSKFVDYIESILDKHGATLKVLINPKKADTYVKFRLEAAAYNYSFDTWTIKIHVTEQFNTITELVAYRRKALSNNCTDRNIFVINELYNCTFLEISVYNLSYRLENDLLYLEGYGGKNIPDNQTAGILSRWSYEIDGDILRMCLGDFLKLYNSVSKISHPKSTESNSDMDPKQFLSLACVCVSIICLLVTIITYSCLPVLWSSPGINNLILSIFLLLAQSIYQFGAGQTSIPSPFCAIIGAVCHFLWLCVVFSMNLCSIQMFIIFKKQIKISPQFDIAQTVRDILYVTGVSMFFVSINLTVSFLRSKGADSGYGGGQICYINSPLMQSVTFVIPSAIIIIMNIVLFCYVVYKIRKIGEASVRINKERNYLGVYARLSTLTGVTWLFGYLRILLELEVLEYLFIVFNASQGVFIMVAFVLNHRVFGLICAKSIPSSLTTQNENVVAQPQSSSRRLQ